MHTAADVQMIRHIPILGVCPIAGTSLFVHPFCVCHRMPCRPCSRASAWPERPPERTIIMSEKKYTVVCNGTKVEVTEAVYKLYVTDPENEEKQYRWSKVSRIEIDTENEKVIFVPSREDSIDRLSELGFEFEDTSFTIDALDTAVTVEQALDQLTFDERYIIESMFYSGRSERDLANELGVTQFKIHYDKMKILSKMNKLLRKEEK